MISHRYAAKLPGSAPWVLYELLETPQNGIGQLMDALNLGERTIERAVHDLVSRGLCVLNGRSVTLAHNWHEIVEGNEQNVSQGVNTDGTNLVTDLEQGVNTDGTSLATDLEQGVNTDGTSLATELTKTVQHTENDIPSQVCARIGVDLSSLASKEVLKTTTSKPQDQKQIQTPREEKKSRAAKTEPPETPFALPSDLVALEGVAEAWGAYEMMRQKHKKHPKLSNFARNRLWNALRKFRAEQHDLVEVIAKSEGKGWTDFYRPDPPPNAITTEKPKPRTDFRDNMRADVQRARLNAELGLTDEPDEVSRELENAK
jgi:hypothetical protein